MLESLNRATYCFILLYPSHVEPSVGDGGMKISPSESEAIISREKRVDFLFWLWKELLRFKYLVVLFIGRGRTEHEINT